MVSHADVEPVATEPKDHSWSANLEREAHADDRSLLLDQAREAVALTEAGTHVNLVTHGEHGHPADYLYAVLDEHDADCSYEYVKRCGCGGHVTRVHVE